MITTAVRLYGKNDLRIEDIELPEPSAGELLLTIKASAICSSDIKVTSLAEDHHRVPDEISSNPIILGHEFSAEIISVGEDVDEKYCVGTSCIIQPMLYREGGESIAVGHSFSKLGGYATTVLVPAWIVESGGVIPFENTSYYKAALAEPLACIIAAWRSQYHTLRKSYKPVYGHRPSGKTLLLGGTGSMGFFTALLWRIRADENATLVIYGRSTKKMAPLETIFKDDQRITTVIADDNEYEQLMSCSDGTGFDDIVVFASAEKLVTLGLSLLGYDGCLNMFSGPKEVDFEVPVNFHAVHYKRHHIVGSSGASEEDIRTAVTLLAESKLDPSFLVTHVGGLQCVPKTVENFAEIRGGKKIIYPHLNFPLTEVCKLNELAEADSRFAEVAKIVEQNGFWSSDAEEALMNIESQLEHCSK